MPLPLPQYTRDVPSISSKPRKEMGAVFITDPDAYGTQEFMTQMCVHCQRHWRYVPGSGIERGFCMNCMGPTCGKAACDPCVPFEKMIERIEAHERFGRQLARLK